MVQNLLLPGPDPSLKIALEHDLLVVVDTFRHMTTNPSYQPADGILNCWIELAKTVDVIAEQLRDKLVTEGKRSMVPEGV